MARSNYVSLRGIAYELGKLTDIAELPELQQDPSLLQTFLRLGLQKYSQGGGSPTRQAAVSVRKSLESAKIKPEEIDALVYGTSSVWDSRYYTSDLTYLYEECGLQKAYPVGVFLNECANIASALHLARSLIHSGMKNVVVVLADCCQQGTTRIVPPELSVASDAAASCVVSSQPGGEFAIDTIRLKFCRELMPLDPAKDVSRYLQLSGEAIRGSFEDLYKATGLSGDGIAQLMTNNFNLSAARSVSLFSGIPFDRIYCRNISRCGHAIAADIMINLFDYASNHALKRNARILGLATGPFTFGSIVLRRI